MFIEQVKTSIKDNIMIIDSEISMKRKILLENILNYIYSDDLNKHKLNISLSNVLYITDGTEKDITIEFNNKNISIETINFLRFSNSVISKDKIQELFYSKSVIIIGCVNRISPSITMRLLRTFSSHLVCIYGDTSLSYQDEYKSFYTNFFTNTIVSISESYNKDAFDINKKKIYNVLMKIRRGLEPEKLSQSSIFNLKDDSHISISEISEILDNEPETAIVIPEVYYNNVNSLLFQYKYNRSDLTPSVGDEFFNVYPLVIKKNKDNEKEEATIIYPMSKIVITAEPLSDPYYSNGRILIDINIAVNGTNYYGVPFDLSFHLKNYSSDLHTEHVDEYEIINNIERSSMETSDEDYTTLKCLAFKVLKPLYVKQHKFKNIIAYHLAIEPIYSILNSNIYSSVCTATDTITINTTTLNYDIDG